MNITIANLESFQEAIKQATKVLKCSNYSERLQLADSMRKGVTCDFFQLEFEDNNDDEDDEVENHNESNSNAMEDCNKIILLLYLFIYNNICVILASLSSIPAIQNDQQFIQTMITQGKRKRKLEEDMNLSNSKIRRITVKTEPEQIIQVRMAISFCIEISILLFFLTAIKQHSTVDLISDVNRSTNCYVFEFCLP